MGYTCPVGSCSGDAKPRPTPDTAGAARFVVLTDPAGGRTVLIGDRWDLRVPAVSISQGCSGPRVRPLGRLLRAAPLHLQPLGVRRGQAILLDLVTAAIGLDDGGVRLLLPVPGLGTEVLQDALAAHRASLVLGRARRHGGKPTLPCDPGPAAACPGPGLRRYPTLTGTGRCPPRRPPLRVWTTQRGPHRPGRGCPPAARPSARAGASPGAPP